ncbi:MAG: ParB/RepB/Spo0J family partition protein [Phycisphaerae bacterium]|nr:ParB/RepB/Spo0J family partition protein [Phycisphaerae bacterium]
MSANSNDAGKRRLGRGLSSLIRTTSPTAASQVATLQDSPGEGKTPISVPTEGEGKAREIPIDQIAHNPHQPRKNFDEVQLAELAQSIRQEGILQPLVVTASRGGGGGAVPEKPFTLIAGERRLRAAVRAGLSTVPCVLRDATDQQMIEWAVIENIQRADLNPIERGMAYREYMDRFGLTQEQVAKRMGQPRATVANFLRMLDLCDDVQSLVAQNLISFGHAKVIAGLAGKPERQIKIAQLVVTNGLSVRSLEGVVTSQPKEKTRGKKSKGPGRGGSEKPAYVRDAEQRLTEAVGTRVTILPGRAKNTGKIVLEYYSLDDFDRIAAALGLDPRE